MGLLSWLPKSFALPCSFTLQRNVSWDLSSKVAAFAPTSSRSSTWIKTLVDEVGRGEAAEGWCWETFGFLCFWLLLFICWVFEG